MTQKYDVVVLGAGVLGLSIAHELSDQGLKVAVVARDLPEDVHSSQFASPWAGANWSSYAANEKEQKRDEITFRRLASLAEEFPELVTRSTFRYVGKSAEGLEDPWYQDPWYRETVFGYREMTRDELGPQWEYGTTFSSYTTNTPRYLEHLGSSLRAKGVPVVRHRVSSLDEAYSLLGEVDLVVNASGLGSRTLLGIEDELVYPARGQTVTVVSPSARDDWSIRDPHPDADRGSKVYIIPRPGPENHVTLGGTFIKDEWSTLPDPGTSERILRECYDLCPALAEGRDRALMEEGREGWEGIEVVSHNVGLRPCREGGMRLEMEERRIGQRKDRKEGKEGLVPLRGQRGRGREVGVCHAYGIGPAGYQASWGIAEEASQLCLGWLKGKRGMDDVNDVADEKRLNGVDEGIGLLAL